MIKELFSLLIIGNVILFCFIWGYIYSKVQVKKLECDNGKKRKEIKKE